MLNDIRFTIQKGKKVTLVGSSESGKATMAKLLLKYYKPEQRETLIDGVDINEISNKSLRRAISYVPQTIKASIISDIRDSGKTADIGLGDGLGYAYNLIWGLSGSFF